MNRTGLIIVILLVLLAGGVWAWQALTPQPEGKEEEEVMQVVEDFGNRLRNVSVLSPTAAADIEAQYGDLVTPELLAEWKEDPERAPGRTTSSPYPDRIEIESVAKIDADTYGVEGRIVEVTNAEPGAATAFRSIALTVKRYAGGWRIATVVLGAHEPANGRVGLVDFAYDDFALKHPGNFRVETGEGLGGGYLRPTIAKLGFPEDMYEDEEEKTNFNDAFMVIGASGAANAAALCGSLSDLQDVTKEATQRVTLNDIDYRMRSLVEAAAGNRYDTEVYRTMHEGKCYEAALTVHTGNIGNYPAGTVVEFDKERAFTMLRDILGTFEFRD